MNKNITFVFLLFFVIIGCNNINNEEIEVIEGIQLGKDYNSYLKQLDSLNVGVKKYYTKSIFFNLKDIESNQIEAHTSDMFDFNELKINQVNHYAILYPSKLEGTESVIQLSVLIGHTDNSFYINDGAYNLTKEYGVKSFNQNVVIPLVEQIKKMLINKYGEPFVEGFESEFNEYFVIEENRINEYKGDENLKGKITEWKTKYLKIELFEGLPSTDMKYSNKGYEMIIKSPDKINEIVNNIDWENDELPCVSYVSIKYSLTNDAIEKLNLNKIRL